MTGTQEDVSTFAGFDLFSPTPRLLGFPVHISNQLNQTGTNDYATRHDVFFVHRPSLLLAESQDILVDQFDSVSYYNGTSVVSGLSRDESVIRVVMEHDLNLRENKAAAHMDTITVRA